MTESHSHRTIVFDSSCWIELLTLGPLAKKCERELRAAESVLVPTVVLYEVYRKTLVSVSEDQALSVVALMSQKQVVDLTREIALSGADISVQRKLPMADSLVLAHAQQENATLVTLENDFAEIPRVKIIR